MNLLFVLYFVFIVDSVRCGIRQFNRLPDVVSSMAKSSVDEETDDLIQSQSINNFHLQENPQNLEETEEYACFANDPVSVMNIEYDIVVASPENMKQIPKEYIKQFFNVKDSSEINIETPDADPIVSNGEQMDADLNKKDDATQNNPSRLDGPKTLTIDELDEILREFHSESIERDEDNKHETMASKESSVVVNDSLKTEASGNSDDLMEIVQDKSDVYSQGDSTAFSEPPTAFSQLDTTTPFYGEALSDSETATPIASQKETEINPEDSSKKTSKKFNRDRRMGILFRFD